jgi:hypothetical protein
MSFDTAIREMIREELAAVLAPIAKAVADLQEQGNLQSQLQSLLGGGARRGPGRPRKLPLGFSALTLGRKAGRRGPKSLAGRGSTDRGCAITGCKRPARSKGYCAAHYQKFRMLTRTKRLPADWVAHASPGTVKDLVLPRGRAGAKALAEARKK